MQQQESKRGLLRRFTPRNDVKTHLRIPAALSARVVLDPFTLDNRGRRESRVPIAPMGPVQQKARG
jgi:hypothetical protein